MSEKIENDTRSFSVIIKTNEIQFQNLPIETLASDLRETIAQNIYEPARSIKLLYKDRILQLNQSIGQQQIENNTQIVAIPCYTMKHGLWNFIDDYNHERNEMQNISLVFFLTDKPLEKIQLDGKIQFFQPIGIYWQSRSINPMPYLENDFKRIERRVKRVTPIFEFQTKDSCTISINIIFRECEQNLQNLLMQYQDRIKSKLGKKQNQIHLDIIYSTVLDQHNYWFRDRNFSNTLRFLNDLQLNKLTSLNLHMQKLNIDGFHLLLLSKYIEDRGENLKSLNLNLRDNSFEGQLIVDLGKALSKLYQLQNLELDFQNVIIYNQYQVIQLFEQLISSKSTLNSLTIYLPKDLNITYYQSQTISHIFQNVLSVFTNLDRLSFISDSRFQFDQDFYPAFKQFILKAHNLIKFDLIFYCDYLRESQFFRQMSQILSLSERLNCFQLVNFTQDYQIQSIKKRYIHLLQIIIYYRQLSQFMLFREQEILFDLFDI
ncbi:hypothetical protein ABPG72_020681 [Tetrahymena utriculariae]